MNTAADLNSLEQLGYFPLLRHARDAIPIHERRHRAALVRRRHRVLQQPAQEQQLLRHHAACPMHNTGTMPTELTPAESLPLLARHNTCYNPTTALKLSLRQAKGP